MACPLQVSRPWPYVIEDVPHLRQARVKVKGGSAHAGEKRAARRPNAGFRRENALSLLRVKAAEGLAASRAVAGGARVRRGSGGIGEA